MGPATDSTQDVSLSVAATAPPGCRNRNSTPSHRHAIPARPVAEVDADLDTYTGYNVLYLRNTAIGNILGLTGASVPCGVTGDGLPVGLMLYARPFAEEMALRAARAYQDATDWHLATPELGWAGESA